ncbi:hypothetical protein [Pantanalinema sp. GBBB05]|uniref:hypothetical protein n=1 Tax=Pantanalinema sp. GBBB05 TaxID=2604139 RepID=UPI001D933E67|nr:DUF2281 domain-containing protein [Pantanalinema sp. GBBB05]
MSIETVAIAKLKTLSPEKQQAVLDFIDFLQTAEWEQVYQGRFEQLRQEIAIGIQASEQGEVVDATTVSAQLQEKLQQHSPAFLE